jgi:hypothetical protein
MLYSRYTSLALHPSFAVSSPKEYYAVNRNSSLGSVLPPPATFSPSVRARISRGRPNNVHTSNDQKRKD